MKTFITSTVAAVFLVLAIASMETTGVSAMEGSILSRAVQASQQNSMQGATVEAILAEFGQGFKNCTCEMSNELMNRTGCAAGCSGCASATCGCIDQAVGCLQTKLCRIKITQINLYCDCADITGALIAFLDLVLGIITCVVCST